MKLDDIDRRLLRALQKDSDLSLDALAETAGLSRNACWRRVKGYEAEGLIRARVALLDPDKLDLGLMAFIQIRASRHDTAWLAEFAAVIRSMPEILSAHRMSGDLDYLLRVRVRDMAGYDQLYQQLIRRVPMADVSASFVMEAIKDTTELPL